MLEVEQDKETCMSFADFAEKFLVKIEKPKPRPKTLERLPIKFVPPEPSPKKSLTFPKLQWV